MDARVVQRIAQQRAYLKATRGRRPALRAKLSPQRPPKAIERSYLRFILQALDQVYAQVRRELYPQIPGLLAAGNLDAAAFGRAWKADDRERLDAFNRERVDTVAATRQRFELLKISLGKGVMQDGRLEASIRDFGQRTAAYQGSELQRQIRGALGIEVPLNDPRYGDRLRAWTLENVELIKSIPRDALGSVERLVVAGVNTGRRWEDLAQKIEDRFAVSRSRAALIARDQVGKFYGSVQRARQTNLGITHYTWRTSLDERVRPEHVAREGKRYAWSDPPSDGHPGQPINCRCTAEPDLSGVLEQLGLGGEAANDNTRPRARASSSRTPPPPPPPPAAEPNGIPKGNVGPFVREQAPNVARELGDLLHVDAMRNAQHLEHLRDLELLDDEALRELRAAGVEIRLGKGSIVDVDVEGGWFKRFGKHVQPRGYGSGSTFKDCYGVYEGDTGRILVGDGPHGSDSVALHEAGHAIDAQISRTSGFSSQKSPNFAKRMERFALEQHGTTNLKALAPDDYFKIVQQVQAEDAARRAAAQAFETAHLKWIEAPPGSYQRPAYFTQGYRFEGSASTGWRANVIGDVVAGRSETFAEAFAVYMKDGAAACDRRFSREIREALEKALKTSKIARRGGPKP